MYKARKNVEIKGTKRDIIEEYANFGSTVYAPIPEMDCPLTRKPISMKFSQKHFLPTKVYKSLARHFLPKSWKLRSVLRESSSTSKRT
jgi:hypothetical protein